MMDYWFLLFPVSGALIGWLCGWIFSRVIIHLAMNQQRAVLTEQLASFISSKIISPDIIVEKVAKPEHFLQLMPTIENHIDEFLRNRLKTAIPMIGMLIGEKTISQLKTVFMKELEVIFPEVLNKYVRDLANSFDFKASIEKKLLSIPASAIEIVLYPSAKKLLSRVGIITGLATGLINLVIHYFIR